MRGLLFAAVVALMGQSRAAPFQNMTSNTDYAAMTSPKDRAQAVKNAFLHAWDGYYQYAFPNDELHPVSNTSSNSRNGWGASAVDALSTATIMGLNSVVSEILNHISTIDFTQTPPQADSDYVSLFETTIRYLGGMISGYDLLKGPFAHLVNNTNQVNTLLKQAQSLANSLSFAFDTPTGIPYNNIMLNTHGNDASTTNGLATTGTLVLEWQHLSDLTGNKTYGDLAQKAESYLLNARQQTNTSRTYPGLRGMTIDLNTGKFVTARGGWGAESDSYYEYLIKMFVYDQTRFQHYAKEWILAANSTIHHVASHPAPRPDLTWLPDFDGLNTRILYSQHLTCFDGGNFILGGAVLKHKEFIDFGLELVKGCRETYTSTATGIGPEIFGWDPKDVPADQMAFYNRTGFWIANPSYDTRPEVIESYYYAYRATGNKMYQDWAWEAFQAIVAACQTGSGFSSISDVNAPGGGDKTDFQESFLFAEVLKYAYMIFAEDAEWQVENGGKNQWVFNTEAHPMKVAGPPI